MLQSLILLYQQCSLWEDLTSFEILNLKPCNMACLETKRGMSSNKFKKVYWIFFDWTQSGCRDNEMVESVLSVDLRIHIQSYCRLFYVNVSKPNKLLVCCRKQNFKNVVQIKLSFKIGCGHLISLVD